jgi:putative flippase GtrA
MTAILANPRERGRFLRFAVVGVIGAVIDFGVMNLLTRMFAMPLRWAGTISFIAAVLSNFTWNRYWTYPDSRSKPLGQQISQFAIVSFLGLLIRYPTLAILEPIIYRILSSPALSFLPIDPRVVADNLTLAVAVIIVMFWNFFVNRYWTYSDVE